MLYPACKHTSDERHKPAIAAIPYAGGMTTSTLSARLREAMTDAKITPTELARRANTSVATVGNWLNDRVQVEQVKGALLLQMCRALRIQPEWLLFGDGEKSATTRGPAAAIEPSHPVKQPVLTSAVQLVGSILQESELPMAPEKQAELITLVYDLLEEGMPEAKVLRFARAAA